MGKPRTIVFRVSKPFQQLVVNYLREKEMYMTELVQNSVEKLYKEYGKDLLERELGVGPIWKRSSFSSRLGATISEKDIRKLRKLSELTGRAITDLLKEGIWKVIKEDCGAK